MYIHCSSCFVQPAHGFPLSAGISYSPLCKFHIRFKCFITDWMIGLCVVKNFRPILFICPSNDIQGWTKPMLQLHLTHFLRNTFSHLLTNTNTSVQGAWLQLHMKNEKGKIKHMYKTYFCPMAIWMDAYLHLINHVKASCLKLTTTTPVLLVGWLDP